MKDYMSSKQTVNILQVYALNLFATNGLLEPCELFISRWKQIL